MSWASATDERKKVPFDHLAARQNSDAGFWPAATDTFRDDLAFDRILTGRLAEAWGNEWGPTFPFRRGFQFPTSVS